MIELIIGVLLFGLVVVCLFLVLLVLLQRGSTQGGLGTAFGGGMADATFGADTGNVLSKATVFCAIVFFAVSLGLYLLIIGMQGGEPTDETLELGEGIPAVEELDTAGEQAEETLPESVEEAAPAVDAEGTEEPTPAN